MKYSTYWETTFALIILVVMAGLGLRIKHQANLSKENLIKFEVPKTK